MKIYYNSDVDLPCWSRFARGPQTVLRDQEEQTKKEGIVTDISTLIAGSFFTQTIRRRHRRTVEGRLRNE